MNKLVTPPALSTTSEAPAKPHDAAPQPVPMLLPRPFLIMGWIMLLASLWTVRHGPLTAECAGYAVCFLLLTAWGIAAAYLDVRRWLGTHLPDGKAGR